MTARARKASAGMSATATASNAAPWSAYPTGHNGATDPLRPRFLNWEEWFQNASTAQRAEMLALSGRQGLLYANQVPLPASGVKANPSLESPCHVAALTRLLAGKIEDLAPVVIKPLQVIDQQLDPAQREAVSRALFTPDVFLLQGLPGTGRSRVVAEILNQATLRGERALFLANHPASLDAVLLRLAGSQTALPLRFLEPGETSATLPADLLSLTLRQRQQVFKEQVLHNATAARAQAQEHAARRQAEETCWAHLPILADRLAEARRQLQDCGERLAKLQGDVHRQVSAGMAPEPCAAAIAQLDRDHLAALEQLDHAHDDHKKQHAAAALELAGVEPALEALRPLADAKEAGRWWSLAWWRATFRGQVPAQLAELVGRRQALETTLQENLRAQKENRDQCQRLHDQFQASRTQLVDAEIERLRQAELEQENALRLELQALNEHWQQQVAILELPAHRPTDETRAAVAAAAAAWENQQRLDAEACQFACQWEEYVRVAGDQLASRLPGWANVLAGTMVALTQDPAFAAAAAAPVDLLVLEEADQFTETDVLEAARHAARWVLVAETHGLAEMPAAARVNGAFPPAAGPLVPRLGCFQKLWQVLHCDSQRLHYAWSREDGRLCCALRPVTAAERVHLEIERVADFPEIELRILAIPKAPPLLAQVVFPADMTINQAKAFIYRELEEVAIECLGRGAWLADEADGFHFHLQPIPRGGTVCVELEKGLCEHVAQETAHTCSLEFARAAGWTRPRVDQWLQRHLDVRDLGRTMALHAPYRMMAGLAGPLNDILFGGAYLAAADQNGLGSLEFVAVPPCRNDKKVDEKRRPAPAGNGRPALPREGAGLEVDLSTHQIADRMPSELRAALPRRGYANYLEAQALIRKLEELVQRADGGSGPVAVIALYEGQVALLRRLADRSEILRGHAGQVEIGQPGAFLEREWMTVLVSLTRSHVHRAVPFGERPSDLAHALTRARERLILFGDPGALVKRSHWQGPLDYLDAAAAAVEARRVTALLRWLGDSKQI